MLVVHIQQQKPLKIGTDNIGTNQSFLYYIESRDGCQMDFIGGGSFWFIWLEANRHRTLTIRNPRHGSNLIPTVLRFHIGRRTYTFPMPGYVGRLLIVGNLLTLEGVLMVGMVLLGKNRLWEQQSIGRLLGGLGEWFQSF